MLCYLLLSRDIYVVVASRCCQEAVCLTENHPHASPNSSIDGTE